MLTVFSAAADRRLDVGRRRPKIGAPRWWRTLLGEQPIRWSRVVMTEQMTRMVADLPVDRLDAVEISGTNWQRAGFRSYTSVGWPGYDVCARPLPGQCDIVIADQVLEHVLWPYRAVRNVYASLAPNGYFLVSTPFLVRIHNYPVDCTRWTETGLRYLLAEGGFPLDCIRTASWGNRRCVTANFARWTPYRKRIHDLTNEPDFPYHVWALAQK